MTAWYNEIEPYAADWLENLVKAGLIPAGVVDRRDIREVRADELEGYTQCHFFAGIGGWAYALALAGWPDGEPVWTGSCPCQPLSSAGQRKGHADERHLWPAFYELVAERRPAVVLGEQVASADGREWLAGVRADLEAAGYAVGAADLCAAGAGAPQIRQRLFWVADAGGDQRGSRRDDRAHGGRAAEPAGLRAAGGLGDADRAGLQARECETMVGTGWRQEGGAIVQSGGSPGFWSAFDLLPCGDGKARRVEPGSFPLADGVSNRVGRLRAYGNAIVPQAAAEFIAAYREVRADPMPDPCPPIPGARR